MTKLRRYAILTHRYLGVFFCAIFLLWFLSGMVMMYRDYPKLSNITRLQNIEPLDPALVRVSPADALARSPFPEPGRSRLSMLEGRPVYRFQGPKRAQAAFWADTGEPVAPIAESTARRAAARMAGLPVSQARLAGKLSEPDQWTLNKLVRPLAPFLKYEFTDAQATEVYVSEKTGEVHQLTRRADRIWGFLGAVIHWWYLTPLRVHTDLWRAVIIGFSFVGIIMTLAGIVIGLWLYSPSKRYRLRDAGPSAIPYEGWKRWHYIVGLFFGLTTFTWILSGMFSMNPFLWSPEKAVDAKIALAFTGGPLNLAAWPGRLPLDAGDKEIEFGQFQGRPYLIAYRSPSDTQLRFSDGLRTARLEPDRLLQAAKSAFPAPVEQVEWLEEYDAYYTDRHGEKRLPLLRVKFADAPRTWLHIDPYEARIRESYVRTSRLERWLYHGLHSLDFPLLYKYRPAWDIVVLFLMAGGTALCITSVWIGWKRLRKGWRDLSRPAPPAQAARPRASEPLSHTAAR